MASLPQKRREGSAPHPLKSGKRKKKSSKEHVNCMFWMARKRRYCGLNRTPGTMFCGVHMPDSEEMPTTTSKRQRSRTAERRKRIPCPHDPNHSIFECNLAKHTLTCPAVLLQRRTSAQVFFCKDCNSGTSSGAAASTASSELEPEALGRLVEDMFVRVAAALGISKTFVDLERGGDCAVLSTDESHAAPEAAAPEAAAAAAAVAPAPTEVPAPVATGAASLARIETLRPASTASLFPAELKRQKHQIQQASIIGHLQRVGVLPTGTVVPDTVFVEFGAGRGMLSSAIDVALPGAHVLLVERSGVRNKADRSLRYRVAENSGAAASDGATAGGDGDEPLFHRVRIDIRHLKLDLVSTLLPGKASSSSSSGSAAAAAPSAAVAQPLRPVAGVGKHLCGVATDLTLRCLRNYSGAVEGFAVAQCCHHLTTYDDYCGGAFLAKFGLTPVDWERVRRATSWAVGYRSAKRRGSSAAEADIARGRVRVGRMAKRLLECGRVAYLRNEIGLQATLIHFCAPVVTPENVLLLAWRTPSSAVAAI